MGGIAGIVHFRGEPPDKAQALQLSSGVAHRGTDDKGIFTDDRAAVVHRRRAMDQSDLKQPATSDRAVLVLDGRIWSGSDQLLEAWNDSGPACLSDTDGPFALAVWERQTSAVWLARGPVGTRPLFWTRKGDKLAFSSEIAPLLRLPWVSRELATESLAEYLAFRYVHAPRTLLRGIHAVPPGHTVRIDRSGDRTERWWVPPWAPAGTPVGDDREVADRVDATLRRAVERRLRGGPVGVLLSGGLDSSAILHHVRTLGPVPDTFTVTFEGERSAEAPIAGRIAKVMGAPHHLVSVSPEQVSAAMEDCTAAMGAPLSGPAALVQYLLFQEIQHSLRVVLSGDGGDEVLGGRGMGALAASLRATRAVGRLPGPAAHVTRKVAGRLGLRNLAAPHTHFGLERLIGGSLVFAARERVAILRDPALARPGVRKAALEPLYQQVESDPLNEILHVRQVGWLCEDTLARSDRMSSHAGIEVRYPMLDREMLLATAALPGSMKVRRKGAAYTTKWPLRQAMRGRMPQRLINRPKRAFPSPMDRWLRGAGMGFLLERTEAICADTEALFDADTVRRLVTEHRSGMRDHAAQLWTLIFFHTWRQGLP